MSDDQPPPDSPWAKARVQPKTDARQRRDARPAVRRGDPSPAQARGERETAPPRGATAPAATERPRAISHRHEESRLYGLNACLAAFAKRPQALRKVYLAEARIGALREVLAWCVQRRLGYRVVAEADLDKLTASRHHEGVCFEMQRADAPSLEAVLAGLPPAPAPALLLWLDGVGNPHNLGALLRSAAHFGVGAAIVPGDAGLDVSGAAARVAEGAAEIVPLVPVASPAEALRQLRAHGYAIAATLPREGVALYDAVLPQRLVLVFGAEGEGMSASMIEAAELRLRIPGSGAIESLNVAASVAVVLGEAWRQRAQRTR